MKKLFLIFIIFYGCGIPIPNKIIEEYRDSLSNYDISLVNHLPQITTNDKLKMLEIKYPSATYANNYNGIHLIILFSKDKILEIESKISKEAIYVKPFIDSCGNIINYDKDIYNNYPFVLKDCKDTTNIYPIPNFEFCLEDLSKDFFESSTLYLLDAKTGKFLDDEFLTENGVGLSESWKHGYSKGIVINKKKKTVIYWLEVW